MNRPADLLRRAGDLVKGSGGGTDDELRRRIESLEAEVKALRSELGATLRLLDPSADD